jgi:predicted kinase
MPLFASDAVRKEDPDFPQAGVEAFNAGAYRPVLRDRVYARLFNLAQDEIKKGRSVVLDATFSKAKWRESALLLADDLKAGMVFVECACQHQTIRQRLARRKSQAGESDARLMHFNDLIAGYEPFGEAMADVRISIDTDQTVEE